MPTVPSAAKHAIYFGMSALQAILSEWQWF